MQGNEIKRCAIYTRKSCEDGLELEYNSLDAQYDAAASYVRSQSSNGWQVIPKRYDDGGFSGGNMERPALKTLLDDIRSNLIDVVVVYKIDRLSRSLCDFTDLSKIFEKHNVSFVSVTQQIDTSNAAGRMMLNILMSFSQFEREMTADRIRDKIGATKRKGLWTGGPVPLGYKVVNKHLIVDEVTAPIVKFAFERFAETASARDVALEIQRKFGSRNFAYRGHNGGGWRMNHIYGLMVTISKLANGNVRVHIDCHLKSGPVRQYFETKKPEAAAHETDSLPFVKMLARSFVWKELLSSGTYADKTDLADVLGISRQNLQQILHLPYLSPVIIEKVIAMRRRNRVSGFEGEVPKARRSRPQGPARPPCRLAQRLLASLPSPLVRPAQSPRHRVSGLVAGNYPVDG